MASRYPSQAQKVRVVGLAGTTRVRFVGEVQHGRSTRSVAVDVHPELIVRIAAALVATKDCACDTRWQRERRHPSELGWLPGHAIWHVENPEMPMPCVDHDRVIDMDALPVCTGAADAAASPPSPPGSSGDEE